MAALIFLFLNLVASLFEFKSRLAAKNEAQGTRWVQFTNNDRLFFIQLGRWLPSVLKAIKMIRPETLVRWHRGGFPCPCCGDAAAMLRRPHDSPSTAPGPRAEGFRDLMQRLHGVNGPFRSSTRKSPEMHVHFLTPDFAFLHTRFWMDGEVLHDDLSQASRESPPDPCHTASSFSTTVGARHGLGRAPGGGAKLRGFLGKAADFQRPVR